MAPETGVHRFEGRDDHRRGRPDHLAPQASKRQAVPSTVMAHAFLKALRRWLERHCPGNQQITIPTGVVSDVELARVLRALFHINNGGN
jgi:hypothetical protein